MRSALFTQKIGFAILLALAVQKAKPIPTARAAVIRRGSTPFLIGPGGDVVDTTADAGDDDTATPTSTSTVVSTTQTTSAKRSSTTHSDSSGTSSSTPSSTASSATPSATHTQEQVPTDTSDRQPSSIKYLVPVFLLIVITLGGWGISKWYNRRKLIEWEEEKREQERGNWKELKDSDGDVDEKDPWYAGESDEDADEMGWHDVELVTARSSGAVSVADKGWGWRSTMNAWKSARGRAAEQGEEEIDEMGQRATIQLIRSVPPSATYQTLPDLEGRPIDAIQEERGSMQAFRDKLANLTSRDQQTPKAKLGRNRLMNKRKGKATDIDPPAAPAWIQPRATSPSQALSPPMQPHLFFHPTPSGRSIHGILTIRAGSESGSDYATDEESHIGRPNLGVHARFPTIPSTATALANSYTAVPERSKSRRGTSKGSTETVVDGTAENEEVDANATPRAKAPLKRNATTGGGSITKTPTMRRSTATTDLANSPSKMTRRSTTRDKSTSSALTSPKRKTKSQRKAEKAHDKVEDILKASWSDRALASPTSCMSLDGAVTQFGADGLTMSPGVEEAAMLSGTGGGIEQRLAMLRNVQI